MPVEESISVKFKGDVGDLEKSSASVAKSFDKVDNAVAQTTKNLSSFTSVSQKVSQASQQMAKSAAVAGGSLDKTSKSSGTATQALVNLSRVAQDAPFGFIGFANNINPAYESLVRLNQQAKETGSTLAKELSKSLIGPAGIGLALSVVSSLLITFGDRIFNSKSAVEKQADAIKKAKQALVDYVDALDDVTKIDLTGAQNAQGELVKLQTLFKAASDVNIPLKERKKIVDELQEQYPKYFKNISDETILAGGAKTAYDNLTKAILDSARARAAQETLVDLNKQLLVVEEQRVKSMTAFEKATKNLSKAQQESINLQKQVTGGGTAGAPLLTTLGDKEQKSFNKEKEGFIGLLKQEFDLRKRINDVAAKLNQIVEQNPQSILDPGGNVPDVKKQEFNFFDRFFNFSPDGKLSEKQRHDLLEAADSFRKEFGDILEGLNFQGSTQEATLIAAKEWWANFQKGIVKLKPPKIAIDFNIDVPQVPTTEGNGINDFIEGLAQSQRKLNPNNVGILPSELERIRAVTIGKFQKLYGQVGFALPKIIKDELGKPIPVDSIATPDLDKALADNLAKLLAFRDALNNAFSSSFQGLFSGLGSNLATAIQEGLSPLEAATSSIADFMGSLISQIGDALIQYGIVKTGLDKILKAGIVIPGVAAIALGVAAKAIGSLIKASKPKGFAEGGLVFGPTLGLVGEGRGTTRSNPEIIAPLNKLSQFIGEGTGAMQLEAVIRGSQIKLIGNREDRRQRRVR